MPRLTKEALSQYIRTECKRQLRLCLSPDNSQYRAERAAQNMPPPQPPRPGLEQIVQAGEEWQAAKLHDLTETFGARAMVGDPYIHPSGQTRYHPVQLDMALARAGPDQFLVEAQYEVGPAFQSALGITRHRTQFDLEYAEARPDIIQVLPSGCFSRAVSPSGETRRLPGRDPRLQLRVIDIKLTAEPSPGYFAEVAYYSMVLAGWLIDHGLEQQFVVVPDGAVWPGSHEAAQLMVIYRQLKREGITPAVQQLRSAMELDLEAVPFEVFAFRVRRFFQDELPEVLSQPWQALEWHVDNRCKGCEYLGYRWVNAQGQQTDHPNHCIPSALREDHLSRVAFISRGARTALWDQGVINVSTLAQRLPDDPAFDAHQVLRATRTVVASRALSLQSQQPQIPQNSGTSAVMPRGADLHIYLSVDFDLGSAITFAFGIQAFWMEPRSYGSTNLMPRGTQPWAAQVFIVDQKDLQVEQRELLAFLEQINRILTTIQGLNPNTTVQFYLWDTLQYDHLTRVIGRHLQAILNNQTIQHLAWLFPPEQVLPNPALASRRSPLTIVRDVVRFMLAAPVPHYYSLLEIARIYHHSQLPANIARFSVHPLFEDTLSDQIPSERAHEIWSRSAGNRYWRDQMDIMKETIARRLQALETVVRRLENDLGQALSQIAPNINVGPPVRQNRLSFDSQLWYTFAKLDQVLAELETHQIRAMPPHEREARFHSARLSHRLIGAEELQALTQLGLQPATFRRVYRMRNTSREVKLREGDINLALAPEAWPGFLDMLLEVVTQGTSLEPSDGSGWHTRMEEVTGVTVAAIDRENCLIAIDPNRRWPTMLDDLEATGLADFTIDAILDPVHRDYFTGRLLAALRGIGNPALARNNPLVRQATGQISGRGARQNAHVPPADLLWNASAMYNSPVVRVLPPVKAVIRQHGLDLNATQWKAWEQALSKRLQLIWGPPGTGKSRTVRAVVLGTMVEAYQQDQLIRILLCTSTYNALDNVLLDVYQDACSLLPCSAFQVYRVRSYLRPPDPHIPDEIDTEISRGRPSQRIVDLVNRLQGNTGITVVGTTPGQVRNLLVSGGAAQQELFDLIVIDEASQMDVAHAILSLCALAAGGSVVLAGDSKQLPPIHQAEPPKDLEAMVGSIYNFCEQVHRVPPIMLEENYRSNSTLVEFSINAGYERTLTSYSPDLRLNLLLPLPSAPPSGWPLNLYWTPEWSDLLNPDHPGTCFVYPEGRSSQWNQFEADAVATLITLLQGRMARQLLNERDPATGNLIVPTPNLAYAPSEFWERAVGVVTPHRAQQGLIVSRLQQIFADSGVDPVAIRGAVDTVERFQGQQRDVIIASFALGDPDMIHEEDEFLMSLNRFNVMASRARAKLIVLVSQQVVNHLSNDLDTLRESRLLKFFVESFCNDSRPMTLGYLDNGTPRLVSGLFKSRGLV
jgi:DNA replication ATP-dependent helicase Dna2